MKFLFSFITTLLLFSSPMYGKTMYVTEDLNVRTQPGFVGEIVDVLEKGDEVEVLISLDSKKDGYKWTYIRHDGRVRACCTEFLSEEKPPTMHLYSNCKITHYCPCVICCGKDNGITASGAPCQINHTVANGALPFGTRLMINGKEYVVEDRGVGDYTIDIFVSGHQEAWDLGEYYADVYIID